MAQQQCSSVTLVLSNNEASGVRGLAVRMAGSRGDVTLVISNCLFFHGLGGGMFFNVAEIAHRSPSKTQV